MTKRIETKTHRYHHGALREALVGAATVLLERGDVGAVSLREAARMARVTPGAPYHHFRDKDDLLAAVALEGFASLSAQLSDVLGREGPVTLERVEELLRAYVEFAREQPGRFRVMFLPELHRPEHPEVLAAAEALFDAMSGLFRSEGALPNCASELAGVVLSQAHGMATLVDKEGLWARVGRSGLSQTLSAAAELLHLAYRAALQATAFG